MTDATYSRRLILNEAEYLYARSGAGALLLRDIIYGAQVSVGDINYHFPNRQCLIEAMLLRALEPIAVERLALLREVRLRHPDSLLPSHVMACLVLPLLHDLLKPRSSDRAALTIRVASDNDPHVRHVMARNFSTVCSEYEQAFVNSAGGINRSTILWRTALICNAVPGNAANHSLVVMCERMLDGQESNLPLVMHAAASLAEDILNGGRTALRKMELAVADTVDVLEQSARSKKFSR